MNICLLIMLSNWLNNMIGWSNIRKNRFGILVFLLLSFLSIIFIQQKRRENEEMIRRFVLAKSTVPPKIYDNLKSLREKLVALEYENNVRTQELLTLRLKLKETFAENMTDGDLLSLPSIYNLMPHLLSYKDALTPQTRLSKNRKGVLLAFGIPTVQRDKKSYLIPTLQSLIRGLDAKEKQDVMIIVYIGELNTTFIQETVSEIKAKFPDSLESGLIEIVTPPRHFYPELDHLPSTFGDPKERVKWRAKQNLDYAFLMMYAQSRAVFYVQMEDDVIATPSYASTIKSFALQQPNNQWFMLEFSSLGFIGKLFHSIDLHVLVEFFLLFFKEKPNDWLLDHVLWVKVCNPEKSNEVCKKDKAKLRIKFKPSLFQHVGKESSLKGKKQNLVDKDFKKQSLFRAHLNPPANVETNLHEYQTFTAFRGYLGHTFFWATTPVKDSVVRFLFHKPQIIRAFLFRSGNAEHPNDILVQANVEVLQSATKQQNKSDYITVGTFDQYGSAKGNVSESIGNVAELRIRVLADLKDNWIVISEFFVDVKKP